VTNAYTCSLATFPKIEQSGFREQRNGVVPMPLVSMIVFFNRDSIPPASGNRLAARKRVMEEGIQLLRKQFPDLKIGPPISISCAVGVQVDGSEIEELIDFLHSTKLGTFEFDGAMITAAQGPSARDPYLKT
jgi:hypothetical protein